MRVVVTHNNVDKAYKRLKKEMQKKLKKLKKDSFIPPTTKNRERINNKFILIQKVNEERKVNNLKK